MALHWQLRTRVGEGNGAEFNLVLWASALLSGAAFQLFEAVAWSALSPIRPAFSRSVGLGVTVGSITVPLLAVVQVIGSPDLNDAVHWWGLEASKTSVSVLFFVLGLVGCVSMIAWWALAGTLCQRQMCCCCCFAASRGSSSRRDRAALAYQLDTLNDPDVPPCVRALVLCGLFALCAVHDVAVHVDVACV